MKRYVPALALGLFLYFLPSIATGQQPNIIKPEVTYESVNIDEQCLVENNIITKGEYIHQLLQATDLSVDLLQSELQINKEKWSEQLTFIEGLDITIKALEVKGVNVSYFKQENQSKDNMATAYSLGLIEKKLDIDDQTPLDTQRASKIIDNLTVLLNSPLDNQNALGVSYTVKPLNINTILLELRWGKKPSSGYNIKIVDTQYQGDTLYVNYVTTEPKLGAAYLTVITYPNDKVIIKGKVPQRVILYQLN